MFKRLLSTRPALALRWKSRNAITSYRHIHASIYTQQTDPSTSTAAAAAAAATVRPSSLGLPHLDVPEHIIDQYASRETTGVTLRQMFQLGYQPSKQTLLSAAQFLHKELGIRFAKRIRDLEGLPFGLSKTQEIQDVLMLYKQSFAEILQTKYPTNETEELQFTERVKLILSRHQQVVLTMSPNTKGAFLLKINRTQIKQHFLLQEFLDRFNMARIGLRMIMAQHVALHTPHEGWVGVINGKCDPAAVVREAIEDATKICIRTYGVAPSVNIIEKSPFTFRYVPSHLRYMVFELLKNSMRAVIEHHRKKAKAINQDPRTIDYPAIEIIIVDGTNDIVIKISDRGGGIRRLDIPYVFTYTFTTATESESGVKGEKLTDNWLTGSFEPILNAGGPMFGDAFGLPISRLYARYFGGDLQLYSMKDHGTDAYLYLNKLGNSDELLSD